MKSQVTNHLIFYSVNTFILISVFSNLFWSFNMGRKWKGNGPAAQQDDGEASGQLQDDEQLREDGGMLEWPQVVGGITERPWDDGEDTGRLRDDGEDKG